MTRTRRITAMATTAGLATALALVTAAPAQADTLDVCASCTYTTIQAAVNAADPGDTISIAAGTYAESVTIDIPLTLVGPNDGVEPDGTRAAEAIIRPDAGADAHAIILTADATDVQLRGLSVDLDGRQNTQRLIDAPSATKVLVQFNTFLNGTESSVGAFRIQGPDLELTFASNLIEGGEASNGLWAHVTSGTGDITVTDNIWRDNKGLAMNVGASPDATMGGMVSGNWIGNTTPGTGGVDNWGLRQGGMVIAGEFADFFIVGNEFINPEDAVISLWTGLSGSIVITHNIIDGYSNVDDYAAIYVRPGGGSDVSEVVFQYNRFDNPTTGSTALLNQYDSGDLNAILNWWGQDEGPADVIEGYNIGVEPWLTTNGYGAYAVGNRTVEFFPVPGSPTVGVPFGVFASSGLGPWLEVQSLIASQLPAGGTPFSLDGATLLDITLHEEGPWYFSTPPASVLDPAYTICVDAESGQRLWHYEGGAWVDITDRALNGATLTPVAGKVCGMVEDFSPFAVAGAAQTIPATGADSGAMIIAGGAAGLLLLAGAGVFLVARRRVA